MGGRKGDWIQTRSGRRFWVEDPQVDEVALSDILFGLSNLTRFGGQTEFYSVAQHSVHVAELVCAELRLPALLHDAAEAYMGDIVRPLKVRLGKQVEEIERRLLEVIGAALGVTLWPMHPSVKEADEIMLATEKRDLLLPLDWAWVLPAPRRERVECWDPWTARGELRGALEAACAPEKRLAKLLRQ